MKKGISPVVASVFLIIITITLAIVIFSWSSSFVKNLSPPTEFICEEVKFEAAISASDTAETTNYLEINNIGNKEIKSFIAKITNPSTDSTDVIKIDLKVLPGESKKMQINFQTTNDILIIPIINNEGEDLTCPDSSGSNI